MSKYALKKGSGIQGNETRVTDNYRTRGHRTVAYENLLSKAGVHLTNRLRNSINNAKTTKAFKLALKSFYCERHFVVSTSS